MKHPNISRIEQEYIVRSLRHQVDFSNVSCLFYEKQKIGGNIYNIQRNPITLAQIHKCNAYQVKNRLLGFLNVCLSGWKRENTIMTYKYSFNHVEVVNSAANYHNSSSYAKFILLIYLLSYLDTTTYCMEFVSNFNSLHGCGCVSFHNGMGHVHFPNPNTRFYGSDTSVWYCYGKYSKSNTRETKMPTYRAVNYMFSSLTMVIPKRGY